MFSNFFFDERTATGTSLTNSYELELEVGGFGIKGSAVDDYDSFGRSVALSGDGSTAIIGARSTHASGVDAVYAFTRSGSTWSEQQKILEADNECGAEVAVSYDGNTAVVSFYSSSGVKVYTRSGSTWSLQQALSLSDGYPTDYTDWSIAISGDGDTVAVGVRTQDVTPNSNNGAVYVFTRSGSTWTEEDRLVPADTQDNDEFGNAVALSYDGNQCIAGAWKEDTTPNTNNGAVYAFSRSGTTWTEDDKLEASDAASNDLFGGDVTIDYDGNTAVVMSNPNDAFYVFTRSGTTWTEQQKITNGMAGTAPGRVSINGDGDIIAFGAYGDTGAVGKVGIYGLDDGTWSEGVVEYPNNNTWGINDYFGWDVSLSSDGSTVLVGAYGDDAYSPNQTDCGKAYIYTVHKIDY